jgi:DsbC/DsbD-like thiol-disulfide interchange protein
MGMTRRWTGIMWATRLVAAGSLFASTWPMTAVEAAGSGEPRLASPWVSEQASRARMIAGRVEGSGAPRIYAGLEIELDDGWKTYWRNPGSSGVPPRIELEGSENLAKAELLFPAPLRFKDRDGDTIGYKKSVVLPVALTAKDPSKPIVLKVAAEFGICREVCIPVQPALSLSVPPDLPMESSESRLASALSRVPLAEALGPNAPRLLRVTTRLAGDKPELVIEAVFPGDADRGDIFLEAPDGIWIPMPQAAGQGEGGARRFVVDLTDGADLADLKGRSIRVTLVGSVGQSELRFDLVDAN